MPEKKTTKETPSDPFAQFTKIMERHRKEMEKLAKPFFEYSKQVETMLKPMLSYKDRAEEMAKPFLDYQGKILEESKRFQDKWTRNVLDSMEKLLNQIVDQQKKQADQSHRLIAEMDLPAKVKKFIQESQKIQEKWIEQFNKAIDVIERNLKGRQ